MRAKSHALCYRNCIFIPAKTLAIVLLTVFTLLAGQCTKPKAESIISDFESDPDLDRFIWKCHVLFFLSNEHATHGKKSLRLELFPYDYPGLEPMLAEHDWRGYSAFCFDVFNPRKTDIPLSVRIDDRRDSPDPNERYNATFTLYPGPNTICIPFTRLVTSGTHRKLDLKRIYKVLIFMAKPEEKEVLYFDYLRLTR